MDFITIFKKQIINQFCAARARIWLHTETTYNAIKHRIIISLINPVIKQPNMRRITIELFHGLLSIHFVPTV